MQSIGIPTSHDCTQTLQALIELGKAGHIPWLMLRPRDINNEDAFQGDFDFLIDAARFDEILRVVFSVCRAAGVSFIVRQMSPFKRQIELLDDQARRITLELWTQAELRTRGGHGHFSRAAVAYGAFENRDSQQRDGLLAALFLLHLHHKDKDVRVPLVRARLAYFADRTAVIPSLRGALDGLLAGNVSMEDARWAAYAFLREHDIAVVSPTTVALRRLAWHLGRMLHWPSWRTTAVVGPDGSGKGALIDGIKQGPLGRAFRFQRFKRFFRRPLFYWVHSEPRNVRDEKLLWLVLPTAWTYFSLSRLFTGWNKPLILDRYFYDYFVRNVRAVTMGPFRRIGAYALCSALAPRPQRLIVASCPTAVIRERKLEMTPAAIEAMYEVYLDQVTRGRLPLTLFCCTGTSLELARLHAHAFLEDPT
jgi:hypothetical protein